MNPSCVQVMDALSLPALTDVIAKMVLFRNYTNITNKCMVFLLSLYALFAFLCLSQSKSSEYITNEFICKEEIIFIFFFFTILYQQFCWVLHSFVLSMKFHDFPL